MMRQKEIFLFWLPLFASWLLMTAEGPLLSSMINRLPHEVVMLAALGIVFSLAVTIESPVINLLSTATALVEDHASYLLVRRFTVHAMIFVTGVGGVLAFTPLFGLVVIEILGTPTEVARWVRPGLQGLVLWSAAIAWRRFLQGILIRFGEPRLVARGTFVRLVATAGTAFGLYAWSSWPGIYLAAAAMMAGVTTEALYATWVSRPLIRQLATGRSLATAKSPGQEPSSEPLTYRRLFWFHLPLAATSVLTLMSQPLVAFTLARLDRPTLSLAAWPLVFQAMLMLRASAFALPEMVIALADRPQAKGALQRFSLTLAATVFLVMVAFASTPLLGFYLLDVQDTTQEIFELTRVGLLLFLPLPALTTLVSWVRGLLIHRRATRIVNAGMVVQLTTLICGLATGLMMQWPGIAVAAVTLDVAWGLQFLYLFWQYRRLEAGSQSILSSRIEGTR